MQFKIKRTLEGGRYFIDIELLGITDADKAKAEKFGWPHLNVKSSDGREYRLPLDRLTMASPFGFYKQEDANVYLENIKTQITVLKLQWDNLDDTWTNEEII